MPNYCGYQMKVKGKPENVDEFVKVIQADYSFDDKDNCICDVGRHFWRVFYADIYDEEIVDGVKSVYISGSCAWSVYSCMMDGPHTYNEQYPKHCGTTLAIESKQLELEIEVFSEEPGVGFMEHFVIIKGDIVTDACIEYCEYDTEEFDTVKEMNETLGTKFTKRQFAYAREKDDGYIRVGGIPWDFTI